MKYKDEEKLKLQFIKYEVKDTDYSINREIELSFPREGEEKTR